MVGAFWPISGSPAFSGIATSWPRASIATSTPKLGLLSTLAGAGRCAACRASSAGGIIDLSLPFGMDVAFGVILVLVAALVWAWRSRQRPLILGGLLLIVGGYGLTYPFRTVHGPHWILEVQRYHLFPQLGLVLLLAPACGPLR